MRLANQMKVDEQSAAPDAAKQAKIKNMRNQIEESIRSADGMRMSLLKMVSTLAGMPADARVELEPAECFLLGDSEGMVPK